jgi:EmrB/QacA subfamily drug resistance transporter
MLLVLLMVQKYRGRFVLLPGSVQNPGEGWSLFPPLMRARNNGVANFEMMDMSRKRVIVVVIGIMFSLFMAAVETTVVATAMPSIVGQLGGLAHFSWVFSAYMIATTTTTPLYGKLSDIYGRRPTFLVAMAIFLVGSILSAQSQSMNQLIGFRAIQGLGAGGLMPLSFIIIGDLFSFEQRARMQGLFSGVWGVASILGPLLGGFLVDQLNWRWVFYINVIPGFLAGTLFWTAWRESARHGEKATPPVDYAGAGILTAGVVSLLLGLFEMETAGGLSLIAASAALFAALYGVERRAVDPVLPLSLFRDRLFVTGVIHGTLAGWAVFGSASFVPLFVQLSLEKSATVAGTALMPQMLAWVIASIIGSRLLLRLSYRTIILFGMACVTVGSFLLCFLSMETSLATLMFNLGLTGVGMGFSVPAFMIAVQSTVAREKLGTATATLQFSRIMGGAVGVSVMGLILSRQLTANLMAAGAGSAGLSIQDLIRPLHVGKMAADAVLRNALTGAVESVFIAAFVAAALGLAVVFFTPRIRLRDRL